MASFRSTDIALVTGGDSGMGRATCKLLAQQGATVVVTDIDKMAADDTVTSLSGENHSSFQLNIVKMNEIETVFSEVIKKYSSTPNIIINCAGIALIEPFLNLTEEKFDRVFDINVKGTVQVTQVACRELIAAKKSGSIVNIASTSKEGQKGFMVYSASKGAVESFSRSAAKEFGPHGIRVNVISPGLIETPMSKKNVADEWWKQYCQENPLGRPGKPEEIAELVVFLASNKSSYINGASIYIHGGQL